MDVGSNALTNGVVDANQDRHPNRNRDGIGDTVGNSEWHSNVHRYAQPYKPDGDADANRYRHADIKSDTDGNANVFSYSDTNSDPLLVLGNNSHQYGLHDGHTDGHLHR